MATIPQPVDVCYNHSQGVRIDVENVVILRNMTNRTNRARPKVQRGTKGLEMNSGQRFPAATQHSTRSTFGKITFDEPNKI